MFLLFHIGSDLILSRSGSLFLFISVVAFVASRQKWDSIWFMAWLCFGSTVAFNAQCMLTMGVKKCFAICDQTVFLSLSSFAVHFARILFLLVFNINHFQSSFFNIQAKHISFYFLKRSFVVIFPFS